MLRIFAEIASVRFEVEADSSVVLPEFLPLDSYSPANPPPSDAVRWVVREGKWPPSEGDRPLPFCDVQVTPAGYEIDLNGRSRTRIGFDFGKVTTELAQGFHRLDPSHLFTTLSSLWRVYFSLRWPHEEGLVLHAASISDRNGGKLFLGVSGAGKSTLSALNDGRPVFNDEISLIRRINGIWTLCPSPFYSVSGPVPPRALTPQPLKALYFLHHAPVHQTSPLTPARALPRFMRCVVNFLNDPESQSRLLHLCSDLVERSPSHTLSFRKDTGFWSILPD